MAAQQSQQDEPESPLRRLCLPPARPQETPRGERHIDLQSLMERQIGGADSFAK